MSTPVKVTLELPAEIMKRFEERAQEEHRALVDLLTERLISTFDEDDEDEDYEDSDEQILEDLKQSLQEASRGEWLDFDEVMDELKRKYNADHH